MWKPGLLAASALVLSSVAFADTATMPLEIDNATGAQSASQITEALTSLGYNNITNVEMDGNIYTADASWQNKAVKLRVDDTDGKVSNLDRANAQYISVRPDMTTDELASELTSAGYSNVRNVTQNGEIFTAKAESGGQTRSLYINSTTGEIMDQDLRPIPATGAAGLADSGNGSDRHIASTSSPSMKALSEDAWSKKVEQLGYTDPHDMARHGDTISLTAMRRGHPVALLIDTENGMIARAVN